MHAERLLQIYIHNHAAKLVAFYTFNFKVELYACKLHNNFIIPFFLIYAGETLILIIGCTIKRGFATNFTSEYLNVYFF